MDRLTSKCSVIFVATKRRTQVFRSLNDIPEELREKLLETTRGGNSATILIADKGGREEILKAMRQTQPERYSRILAAITGSARGAANQPSRWRFVLPIAGRIILAGACGYVIWVLATLR